MNTTPVLCVDGNVQASTSRTRKRTKRKLEFVGWGSRELIEFLQSIGKDTTKAMSHYDVTDIVKQYVIDSKLTHPVKKKRVLCDERLQVLFGGKKCSVSRNKIHGLMEPHLLENHGSSEEDRCNSEGNEDDRSAVSSKRRKVSTFDKKPLVIKTKVEEVSKSSLAAISPENIKHVYLKKAVVEKLLSDLDTFESKVVGSFVKTKSDPYDIYQKNYHQLQLVTGVKKVVSAGDDAPPVLRLSNIIEDVNISVLSDGVFLEEECEDLHRRIKEGLIKHPTVGELEQKAVMLHEEITKNWIETELLNLRNRINQANEKGWRDLLAGYRDQKRLLETPEEKSRLLNEIPKVLPEKVEPETIPDDPLDDVNQDSDDSPKAADWDWYWANHNSSSDDEGVSRNVSSKQGSQGPFETITITDSDTEPSSSEEENLSETEEVRTECDWNFSLVEPNGTQAPETESNGHAKAIHAETQDDSLLNSKQGNDFSEDMRKVDVITLSDDEDEIDLPQRTPPAFPDPECFAWYYLDRKSKVQGPFSLLTLKRWSDRGDFKPGFRVWMRGQKPEKAVLLEDVLRQFFP